MYVARQPFLSNGLLCLATVSGADISNCLFHSTIANNLKTNNGCIALKGHTIIGFNHGVLGLAESPAIGPGFFRQNTSGYALGVLTPKASPSGWVFSQAQHPMIKTYNTSRRQGQPLQFRAKNPRSHVII